MTHSDVGAETLIRVLRCLPSGRGRSQMRYLLKPVYLILIVYLCGCVASFPKHNCVVESEPSGANVSIDGQYIGKTPCAFVMRADCNGGSAQKKTEMCQIELSKTGYETELRRISLCEVDHVFVQFQPVQPPVVQGGIAPQQQQQNMQQEMMGPTIVIGGQTVTGDKAVEIKEYGMIKFESKPPGAEVYIESNLVGNTPTGSLRFQAGTYGVDIRKKGYKSWHNSIMVVARSTVGITAELESE
jgi:hypothetical protein